MKGQNLISPREALLRRQSDAYMKQNVDSASLALYPDEKKAVEELLTWARDNLRHNQPLPFVLAS
jgi:hypothetical protein